MKRIFRFIIALTKYIIWGNRVSVDKYNNRMAICKTCDERCGRKCCVCGCYLTKKLKWSTESCPKNKW